MNVIEGDANTFNALLYPAHNSANLNYFKNQWDRLSSATLEGISDIGRSFLDTAKNMTNQFTSDESLRAAKNALIAANMDHRNGYILPFASLEGLQVAPSHMQQWLMANPNIKQRYNNQTIDGYSDSYQPVDNSVGEYDYFYRRVMDGMLEEAGGGFKINHYMETPVYDGETELTVDDKMTIVQNWHIMNAFIDAGDDPTNPFGGTL